MDDNGHGTFVAGEIGAVGNNGVGVTGVNWNVTIMPLKFLDANGGGYTSDAIRAINYATMERTQYGVNVRVINASWSSSQSDAGLNAAIQAAGNAGILFVAAAGNSASNNDVTPQYPANSGLANVVSVAASDSSDRLATFSNYGANTVNLAAPGVSIYGTLPGGKYGYLSGTSMATPEVAGVAALAWAADPNATVAQVRNALLQGVDKIPALAGKVSSGGRPECLQHLETPDRLPAPLPAPAPSPAPFPRSPARSPTPDSRADAAPVLCHGTNVTTAVAVAIGSTAQGDMANASDTNYFKVQVVAGQKYTFQTVLGSLYDSVLTLLGTNGQTVIAQNDDMAPGNRASCITWQATRQRHVLPGREQLSGLAAGLVYPDYQRAVGFRIARRRLSQCTILRLAARPQRRDPLGDAAVCCRRGCPIVQLLWRGHGFWRRTRLGGLTRPRWIHCFTSWELPSCPLTGQSPPV